MHARRRFVTSFLVVLGLLAPGLPAAVHAQDSGEFVPVTDAMLQDPDPDDWLMWRRTLDTLGYSPLDQIDRGNVGDIRMVWTRALGPGLQQGTPVVYDGVMYMPNPRDVIQALDAVTGDLIWEYRRDRPDDLAEYMIGSLTDTNRNIAIWGELIIDTSGDDYIFALDAKTGELVWETEVLDYRVHPANQTSGPHRRRRQGGVGPELRPQGRPPCLRHRGPRRHDGRGAVAPAAHPRPRRARRRELGQCPLRGAEARRLVDGAELRPRAEPRLRRHVGHLAGPQVHDRRDRPQAPVPQLDPRPRRRHRRDRLVLPASERPLGPRPPVRAAAPRHRGGPRPRPSFPGSTPGCSRARCGGS